MNELSRLKPPKGARKKRKRVGRGPGSGTGKTCGKGHKGQNSRSGGGVRPGFEGGQMPLQRRVPKRGFTPLARTRYTLVNIADLNHFADGTEVTLERLAAEGFLRHAGELVKILGDGELERSSLKVQAHKFSKSAAAKLAAKGGTAQVI